MGNFLCLSHLEAKKGPPDVVWELLKKDGCVPGRRYLHWGSTYMGGVFKAEWVPGFPKRRFFNPNPTSIFLPAPTRRPYLQDVCGNRWSAI